ncbi:MAG TPA: PAS domain S-box protein, partial [Aquabacterium sp.]|nr:PAS domain S-box protein [Aquabacterium sp.]
QGQDIAYLAVSGDEVAWGQMREAMRQGRAWEGAVHVRRRDGGVYLDARKLTPIVGQQGHLSGFVMMGEDITERDRVASMLRASEERWRALLAASPDAVLVLDEQGCIQQINPAVEHMFGYRSAELLGRSAWMLWPDAPLHVAPVAESVLAWVQSKIDTEVQRKDGSLLHVNLRSGTVSLSDGQYVVAFMRDISERIQAQAELAESEARYRTMMSTAMDGVVIFDQQTRILAVNEAYAAMSGYSRAELLQMRVADIKADLDDAGIHGYMAEVIRTGGAQFEGLHRTKSGHIYPIEATVTYSSLGGGQFFSFVRDLTERRAAEKALRESEERFELALKASNDGIWDSNVPAGTFYLSPRWKEIVGYRDDELPSNRQTFSALLHPDDGLAVLLALDDLEQGRGPERVEVEFRVRHKAGYWVPVLSRGQLVRGEQGEVIRVIGTTTDLTERKRADEALRESEDKLRNLFELSPLGIALCTLDGNLVEFNEAYRALTGYSAQDLRKLSYWDLTPPEYMRSEAEQLKVIARTGRYGPYEKEYVRADGSRIPLRFNGVRIELGGRPHIWSMVEDLTESRRVEAERQAMQQQQMQSQKLEALGHLTGGIAHDFNNMLAGIMGLASLGLERHVQDPDGKLARYLREIVRTTERGRDLVAKMLAYVRTEEPENVAPRNLAPLVGEMVDMLKSSLPSSVVLSLQCIEPLPAVRISAVDVHQIIMNLVLNARDAVGVHGEIRIRLASVTLRDEVCANCHEPVRGDFLLLEVRDNGSGIAPEALPKIFDPFFTTKDVGKGSGLGLPSVIGLAHKAGGHMQVESRPGAGTVMRVLLPAAREHVEVQEDAPEPLHIEVRECVWVVDDDPAVLVFLTELLLEHGFGVTSFSDPLEALGALRAALAQADGPLPMPSVLITDQTMPGLSGADLVRAALELDPSLRVILCTGYSEHIDADSARDLGVKHFLRKPFDSQALLRVLAEEHAELRAVAAGRRPG